MADAQPGKLQRAAAGTGRQPLADALPPPAGEPMLFAIREDDALNEKMKRKNKMDYKVCGSIPLSRTLTCVVSWLAYQQRFWTTETTEKNGPVTCHSMFPFNN